MQIHIASLADIENKPHCDNLGSLLYESKNDSCKRKLRSPLIPKFKLPTYRVRV